MDTKDEKRDNYEEKKEVPANDIVPERDVLMMEKQVSDFKSADYKPADKKLLRNIILIVLFLIVLFLVMFFIVRSSGSGDDPLPAKIPKEMEIRS